MLLGTVKEIGPKYPNPSGLKVGDKIASLVSLSLTPLYIEKILEVFPNRDQVKIKGHAVLFESGILEKLWPLLYLMSRAPLHKLSAW